MLLRVISDRAIAALVMSGHNRQWLTFSAVSFIVNLALDLLLIPPLGMIGAALSTMAVNIFLLIALAAAIWQRLGIRLFERSLLVFIPIALVSVVVGRLPAALGWLPPPLLDLVVYTAVAGGVCALLTWRFILPPDERGLVVVFMRRLTRVWDK
jgi:O-antigen/teichoic acid export membrane protein